MADNQGYATAPYGKWHLGPVKAGAPNNPGSQGFDQWLSHDNYFEINPPLRRNGAPLEIHQCESSEIIVREAISFIEPAVERQRDTILWYCSDNGEPSNSCSIACSACRREQAPLVGRWFRKLRHKPINKFVFSLDLATSLH